jgi:hypothetical protein
MRINISIELEEAEIEKEIEDFEEVFYQIGKDLKERISKISKKKNKNNNFEHQNRISKLFDVSSLFPQDFLDSFIQTEIPIEEKIFKGFFPECKEIKEEDLIPLILKDIEKRTDEELHNMIMFTMKDNFHESFSLFILSYILKYKKLRKRILQLEAWGFFLDKYKSFLTQNTDFFD